MRNSAPSVCVKTENNNWALGAKGHNIIMKDKYIKQAGSSCLSYCVCACVCVSKRQLLSLQLQGYGEVVTGLMWCEWLTLCREKRYSIYKFIIKAVRCVARAQVSSGFTACFGSSTCSRRKQERRLTQKKPLVVCVWTFNDDIVNSKILARAITDLNHREKPTFI